MEKKKGTRRKGILPNKMLADDLKGVPFIRKGVMNHESVPKIKQHKNKIQIPGSVMAVVAFLFGCRGGFWEGGCFAKMLVMVT